MFHLNLMIPFCFYLASKLNKKTFLILSFTICFIFLFDEVYNLIIARILDLPRASDLYKQIGFKYMNLHSIRLDLLSINERAHKCYLKCGFKDVGKSREEIFLNGAYYDKLHMDILTPLHYSYY